MQDRLSASNGTQIVMPQKSEVVKTRVSPDSKARFEAVAAGHGLSPSEFLRQLIERVSGDAETTDNAPTKAKREGKLTVRLGKDVGGHIEREAKSQGVAPSTWAARILTSRARSAPQPVKGERRAIRWGFRQLVGATTNLNQIAVAMNRDVFTGGHYAPTRQEIAELKSAIESLEDQLTRYAAGRLRFQIGESKADE